MLLMDFGFLKGYLIFRTVVHVAVRIRSNPCVYKVSLDYFQLGFSMTGSVIFCRSVLLSGRPAVRIRPGTAKRPHSNLSDVVVLLCSSAGLSGT